MQFHEKQQHPVLELTLVGALNICARHRLCSKLNTLLHIIQKTVAFSLSLIFKMLSVWRKDQCLTPVTIHTYLVGDFLWVCMPALTLLVMSHYSYTEIEIRKDWGLLIFPHPRSYRKWITREDPFLSAPENERNIYINHKEHYKPQSVRVHTHIYMIFVVRII